jgi:hypothetical protein
VSTTTLGKRCAKIRRIVNEQRRCEEIATFLSMLVALMRVGARDIRGATSPNACAWDFSVGRPPRVSAFDEMKRLLVRVDLRCLVSLGRGTVV